MFFRIALFRTLAFKKLAQVRDFGAKPLHAFRDCFEFECKLPTLFAESFRLRASVGNFSLQTMSISIGGRQTLLALSELVAQIGGLPERFKNRSATSLLAVFESREIRGGSGALLLAGACLGSGTGQG